MTQFVATDADSPGIGAFASVQFGRTEIGPQFDIIEQGLPFGLFVGILDAPVVGPDGIGIPAGCLIVSGKKEDAEVYDAVLILVIN